ncbi:MAG: hypothetical protein PWP40_279 [Rhodocyclaceae bacterium]|nr:hypothetical protein [Rhodocyclaceae bacterium]
MNAHEHPPARATSSMAGQSLPLPAYRAAGPRPGRKEAHRHQGPRPFPARSLLSAGLAARLGLVAGALALLWTTVLWALR